MSIDHLGGFFNYAIDQYKDQDTDEIKAHLYGPKYFE
jgi:hypothetical protein